MDDPHLAIDLDTEQFKESLKEHLTNSEQFKPYKVVIDAPYAEALEFGTGPANPGNASPKSMHAFVRNNTLYMKETTEVFNKFYEWVVGTGHFDEPYEAARAIYRKIMEEGMAPHPFIRPALHSVEDELQELLEREGSLKGVTEELAMRIAQNLRDYSPYPMVSTGELINSIRVEECQPEDLEAESELPEEVWASDTCDFNGEERMP